MYPGHKQKIKRIKSTELSTKKKKQVGIVTSTWLNYFHFFGKCELNIIKYSDKRERYPSQVISEIRGEKRKDFDANRYQCSVLSALEK